MKLLLVRDQASGLLGGVKFKLRAQVRLTKREADLVRKYRAHREVLLQRQTKIPFTNKSILLNIGISGLINGQEFKCKDIADILEYERNVKEACDTFRRYLDVMSTFGGEEIVNYAGAESEGEDVGPDALADEQSVDEQSSSASITETSDEDDDIPFGDGAETDSSPNAANRRVNEGLDFCYHCGAAVVDNQQTCSECHKSL